MKTYEIIINIKGKEQFELENDSKQTVEEMAYDILRDLDLEDYCEIKIKEIK